MFSISLNCWNRDYLSEFPELEDHNAVKEVAVELKNRFLGCCLATLRECQSMSSKELMSQYYQGVGESNSFYEDCLRLAIAGHYYNGKCLVSYIDVEQVSAALQNPKKRQAIDRFGEILKIDRLGNRIINAAFVLFIRSYQTIVNKTEKDILSKVFVSETPGSISIKSGDFSSASQYFYEYENAVCNYHDFEHLVACEVNSKYCPDITSFSVVCEAFPHLRNMVPIAQEAAQNPPVISGRTVYRVVIPRLLSSKIIQDQVFQKSFYLISEYISNWLLCRPNLDIGLAHEQFPKKLISVLEWCILAHCSGYEAPAALVSTYTNYQKRLTPFLDPNQSFAEDSDKTTSEVLEAIITRKYLTADEVYGIMDVAYRDAIVNVGETLASSYPKDAVVPSEIFKKVLSNLKYKYFDTDEPCGILKPLADWVQSQKFVKAY